MTRLAAIALAVCALGAGACKKNKKGTTPGSSGSVSSQDATDMSGGDPVMGDDVATTNPDGEDGVWTPDPDAGGGDTGAGDDDDDGAGTDPGAPADPGIAPPNLDLPPDVQRQRVADALKEGRDALRRSDPNAAIAEARKALEADSTSIDAVAMLAHAYFLKGLTESAEVVLDEAYKNGIDRRTGQPRPGSMAANARKSAYVHYVYGLVYDELGNQRLARDAYGKAYNLDSRHVPTLINLAAHQLKAKNYGKAVGIGERLTDELDVQTATVWNNLGSAYRGAASDVDGGTRQSLLRKAERAYKRAIDADKNYGSAYYNLGILYFDANDFPGPGGKALDKLKRLEQAKTYVEEYKNLRGADLDLADDVLRDITKHIKREQRSRKRDDDW